MEVLAYSCQVGSKEAQFGSKMHSPFADSRIGLESRMRQEASGIRSSAFPYLGPFGSSMASRLENERCCFGRKVVEDGLLLKYLDQRPTEEGSNPLKGQTAATGIEGVP